MKITNVLRQQMVTAKREMRPQPRMRFDRESQSDMVDDGTELGLIDILVSYKNWDEAVYLAIECKRISSQNNNLARLYVQKGVFRFASGKYSFGHALAGMVGYVICGKRDKCIKRVSTQLNKEPASESGYDSDHGWQESTDWVDGETQYLTQHQQSTSENRNYLGAFLFVFRVRASPQTDALPSRVNGRTGCLLPPLRHPHDNAHYILSTFKGTHDESPLQRPLHHRRPHPANLQPHVPAKRLPRLVRSTAFTRKRTTNVA